MIRDNFKLFVILFLFIAFSSSCTTNGKVGEKVDKFFSSKRYKEAVAMVDKLCYANKELKNDTLELGSQLRNKIIEYTELNTEYKNLGNKSGLQLAQLNSDLKDKSKELEKKERLLKEREQKLKELQSILAKQDSITNALNSIVKNALMGFKSDELSVEMKNGKVYVSMTDKLLFKSGSSSVEEKGKEAIKKLAEVLNRNQDIGITIEGHTDNVPIRTNLYKDNWDLSVARATNIVRMLNEDFSVDPTRLTASGKGENFPVASNETPEGRAKNRRTEIILAPKLDELFKLINHN